MNGLIWRNAVEHDIDQILEIQLLEGNRPFVLENSRLQYLAYIENDFVDFMIFQEPLTQKEIGFCLLNRERSDRLELKRLLIYKKGNGFGRKSLNHICHYGFEKQAVSKIWLDVFSMNHVAIQLYKKLNFKKILQERQVLLHQGINKELIVMELDRITFEKMGWHRID